jgi:hypothetical protein
MPSCQSGPSSPSLGVHNCQNASLYSGDLPHRIAIAHNGELPRQRVGLSHGHVSEHWKASGASPGSQSGGPGTEEIRGSGPDAEPPGWSGGSWGILACWAAVPTSLSTISCRTVGESTTVSCPYPIAATWSGVAESDDLVSVMGHSGWWLATLYTGRRSSALSGSRSVSKALTLKASSP